MTGDAKTILLFTEQRTAISYLADEQAGQLFKSLYAYADEGALPDFEDAMMSVFTMLQSQIDRSAEANAQKRYAARPANISTLDCVRMPPHTKNCDCMPSHPVACLPNPNSNPNPHIDDRFSLMALPISWCVIISLYCDFSSKLSQSLGKGE